MLIKIILLAAMSATFTGCMHKSQESPNHVSQPNSISKMRIIDTVEHPITMQATGTAIRLYVNGNQSAASPKIISGTTYVPVRAAGELLKKYVTWDAVTKTVYMNDKNQSNPKTASNSLKLIVNGKQANTAPKILNSVTYVPVRAAGELLKKYVTWDAVIRAVYINNQAHSKVIYFPAARYPQTTAHIKTAIGRGESPICTIDRGGADHNREESLSGIPTKDGYDRDEFPMAMCAEGGAGADVAYVKSSDNRGAGSWVGNRMQSFPDGTRVLIIIDTNTGSAAPAKPIANPTTPKPTTTPKPVTKPSNVYYKNCSAVRAAGKAPLLRGQPGYSTKLDRDHDGVACE